MFDFMLHEIMHCIIFHYCQKIKTINKNPYNVYDAENVSINLKSSLASPTSKADITFLRIVQMRTWTLITS